MAKVVVIGLDGATLDLIKPWALAGKLPTFKRLIDEGIHGPLKSTIPPYTIPAWPSMLTGKNPGKLGVSGIWRAGEDYEAKLSPLSWGRWTPIWELLNKGGKRVCMVNVPTTIAPDGDFDGAFITGPQSQGGELIRLAYPLKLEKYLRETKYRVYAPSVEALGEDAFLQYVSTLSQLKMDTALRLFKNDWDFFMFGLFYLDPIQHFFWKYMDETHPLYEHHDVYSNAIFDYYFMIDRFLDRFLSDHANLFVVSDHGFGKLLKFFNLNLWLKEEGFLALKPEAEKEFSKDLNTMMTINGREYYARLRLKITNREVDWLRTKAFSPDWAVIRVNLKGRERMGAVQPGREYDELISRIKKMLLEVVDPDTGERVVENVWRREELYNGEYVSELPDLFIQYRGESWYYNSSIEIGYLPTPSILCDKLEYIYEKNKLTALHKRDGVFIAYGPDIDKGEIGHAEITDIAPTLLHMLDLPIPEDMDGRVLKEIFKENSSPAARDVAYQKPREPDAIPDEGGLSEEEIEEVKRRLKALGYL